MVKKSEILAVVLCLAFVLSMLYVPSAAAASETKLATEFRLTSGTPSGSVTNTQADDGVYHVITAFKKTTTYNIDVWYGMQPTTYDVSLLTQIFVRVNAKRGSQTCMLIEEWYNFATSSWTSIQTWALTGSDRNYDAWRAISLGNYLNSTKNMRIRFRYSSEVSFQFYIDYLAVTFTEAQKTAPVSVSDCWGSYKAGSLDNLLSDDNTYYQRYYTTPELGAINGSYINDGYWIDSNPDSYLNADDGNMRVASYNGGMGGLRIVLPGYLGMSASSVYKLTLYWDFKAVGNQPSYYYDIYLHNWTWDITQYTLMYSSGCLNNTWETGSYDVTTGVQSYVTDSTGYGDYRILVAFAYVNGEVLTTYVDQGNAEANAGACRSFVRYRFNDPYSGSDTARLKLHFDNVAGVTGYTVSYTVKQDTTVTPTTVWSGTVASNAALDLGPTWLTMPSTSGDPIYITIELTFVATGLSPYFQLDQLCVYWLLMP